MEDLNLIVILERIALAVSSTKNIEYNMECISSGNISHRKASVQADATYIRSILSEIEEYIKSE